MAESDFDAALIAAEAQYPGIAAELKQSHPGVRTFIERVLLGLITERPIDGGDSDQQRLADAMKAIGMQPTHRANESDDERLLRWMATQYVIASRGDRTPSIRSLAEAAAKGEPGHSISGTCDRLREKFANQMDTILDQVTDQQIEVELLHRYALEDLERLFGHFGLDFYTDN
jgi:hypothetical protein